MAAGLNIEQENMERFFRAIDAELAAMPAQTWEKVRWVDGRLTPQELTEAFFANLMALEPHGEKFPLFCLGADRDFDQGTGFERPAVPR